VSRAVIIMGSERDGEYSSQIAENLKKYGVDFDIRVASAHKTPDKVKEIVKENEVNNCVFITVAGRSNALSGMIDAMTSAPVIASPVISDKFAVSDLLSSLRMPSGVGPLTVLEAENTALAAVKILALSDSGLRDKISEYQESKKKEVNDSDERLKSG